MAGKMCPDCGKMTFFQTPTGRKCSQCGYTMTLIPNSGKGGRGRKCSNCGKFTVFDDKCNSCGAMYTKGGK